MTKHESKEYDYEEVDKKSNDFLKRIMGDENFDKLQKNGKIEIEVQDKSNDKIIYELYADGGVINKTKNQSYCLVADRSDYPTADMIAIKYAWLTHNNEIAEKVANKTDLNTGFIERTEPASVAYIDFIHEMEQRGWSRQPVIINRTPWYGDYVDYLSGRGWHRELIAIDHNTSFVSIQGISKDTTGDIVDIQCPPEIKISIMGSQQVPRGANINCAYHMGLHITDNNGEEIKDYTKIRITKIKPFGDVIQLARIFYSDIKMNNENFRYSFRQGIEMNGCEHLVVSMVNSEYNIPKEGIKFKMEADVWAETTTDDDSNAIDDDSNAIDDDSNAIDDDSNAIDDSTATNIDPNTTDDINIGPNADDINID